MVLRLIDRVAMISFIILATLHVLVSPGKVVGFIYSIKDLANYAIEWEQ